MPKIILNAIEFKQDGGLFYLCAIKARHLPRITYVARRGVSDEKGAVQRVLNKKRIKGIKNFLMNGGVFPNAIILNWKDKDTITIKGNKIKFDLSDNLSQLIDGQHRIAGIKEALKEDESIGELEIPTVIALELSTPRCAEIFISINTEQKTVPKSLIYDLYGLLSYPERRDYAIERATDIASKLNTELQSPYTGYIKFPGARRFKGGIQLSTIVDKLKKLVKNEGEFERFGLNTLENQAKVLANYFTAIQGAYGKKWDNLKNPFLYASGFSAALEILSFKLLPICYGKSNFTAEMFSKLIEFDPLIMQSDVKGMSGQAAIDHIKKKMEACIKEELTEESDFAI